MAVKAVGRAALGLMTPHTLQVQSAFQARFINMIQVTVAIAAKSCSGLFLFMASGAGHVVGRFRVGMTSDTGVVGWTITGCVVMTGSATKHVCMHRMIKFHLFIEFLKIINGHAFRSIIDIYGCNR